jgi:hypothetical protein
LLQTSHASLHSCNCRQHLLVTIKTILSKISPTIFGNATQSLLTNRSESVAPHQKNQKFLALQYHDAKTIESCRRSVQHGRWMRIRFPKKGSFVNWAQHARHDECMRPGGCAW